MVYSPLMDEKEELTHNFRSMKTETATLPASKRSVALGYVAGLLSMAVVMAGINVVRSSPVIVYDPYADLVQSFSGISTANPQSAIGAPDGVRLQISGTGTMVTFGMGRGAEGTGNLKIHLGALGLAAQMRVTFLDEDLKLITEETRTIPLSLVPQIQTFSFDGAATGRPYRYIRIVSLAALGFSIDALEAEEYIGSSNTLDSDNDGITDRVELENGSDPFDSEDPGDLLPPEVTIITPINGATVSGEVGIVAEVTDNVGVMEVQFSIDNQQIEPPDTVAPYEMTWDSALMENGEHSIEVIALDTAHNQQFTSIVVNVEN